MKGTAYGIGVGPGDPELMTLQAVRLIQRCPVIALPAEAPRETLAYRIAVQAVPEMAGKTLLGLAMPMTWEAAVLGAAHWKAVKQVEEHLDQGRDVAYLTLGDPSIYSTFAYIQRILSADGYATAMAPGVPSFCAAAARLNRPLALGGEPLHILPQGGGELPASGTAVLMKAGRAWPALRRKLLNSEGEIALVERCAWPEEQLYIGRDALPEAADYLSLAIVRRGEEGT